MTRSKLFLVALVLLVAPSGVARAQEVELASMERQHGLLLAHRGRLEARLQEQVARISRLKAQPRSVARDMQLEAALKGSQKLASKLTDLRRQIRSLSEELARAYDRAIAATSDRQEQARLGKSKERLRPSSEQGPRIITEEEAGPLDSPDDLDEKADLLDDSREKIRRQLARIQDQIATLRHRSRLRRHSQALEESPFDEASTGRAAQRPRAGSGDTLDSTRTEAPKTRDTSTPGPAISNKSTTPPDTAWSQSGPSSLAGGGNRDTSYASVPPASHAGRESLPASPATGLNPGLSTSSGTSGSGAMQVLTLKEAMDPALLQRLSALAGDGGDLDTRIETLRRAQSNLSGLERTLSKKSRTLRQRAKTLRSQK